jgi:hypothetical protein
MIYQDILTYHQLKEYLSVLIENNFIEYHDGSQNLGPQKIILSQDA